MSDKRQASVVAAQTDVVTHLPFPAKGIDSDSGSEFVNDQLFRYCRNNNLKFTRSRSGNKNDGAHVEQKNWTSVRTYRPGRGRVTDPSPVVDRGGGTHRNSR